MKNAMNTDPVTNQYEASEGTFRITKWFSSPSRQLHCSAWDLAPQVLQVRPYLQSVAWRQFLSAILLVFQIK